MDGTPPALLVDAPDLTTERRLFLTSEPSVRTALRQKMGRKVGRSTLYRWMDPEVGCPAGAARVILPVVREGFRVVTTDEAVNRFVDAVRTLSNLGADKL